MDFTILARLGLASGRAAEQDGEPRSEDGVLVYRIVLSADPAMPCPGCGKPGRAHGRYTKEVRLTVNRLCPEAAEVSVPRFICSDPSCAKHGKTFSPAISGIAKGASIPASLKMLAAKALASSADSIKSVAESHGMSPRTLTEAFDGIYKNVARGALGEVLCIDEFRFAAHGESKFPAILVDGTTGFLIDIVKSRQKPALAAYFSSIPEEERKKVKYFSSDMYDGFRYVKSGFFRQATHVVDLFHVVGLLKNAMSAERARAFQKPDGSSPTGYQEDYAFLKKHWKLTVRRERKPVDPRSGETEKSMADKTAKVKRVLAAKDGLMDIYDALQALYRLADGKATRTPAEELSWIRFKLESSGLKEAVKAAESIGKWWREILAAFEMEEGMKRVTNAVAEGMNNRIGTLSKPKE